MSSKPFFSNLIHSFTTNLYFNRSVMYPPNVFGLNICNGGVYFPFKPLAYFCPVACNCRAGDPHCPATCPARNATEPLCPAYMRSNATRPISSAFDKPDRCPMLNTYMPR